MSEKEEKEEKGEKDNLQEFGRILNDFVNDLLVTFPDKLNNNLNANLDLYIKNKDEDALKKIKEYCMEIFPERFFDILYQNNDMYDDDNINTKFLPDIEFKELVKENLTDKTRETIWKYLQLMLFILVSDINSGKSFGDTAKLFEAINEDEFKSKLEETISQMHTIFDSSGSDMNDVSGINLEDLPDPSKIHDHITGMMDGKLGTMAREIAEETAADLNIDMENTKSVNDVFQKLFKNPTKLMGLVKNVGDKLDNKIKSGSIKESELLEEATDIVNKMKDMPGMGSIESMLSKMGMGGMGGMGGGKGKVNMGAMQAHLNKNLRGAQMRDRMRAKIAEKEKAAKMVATGENIDGKENIVFTTGEKVEKSVKSENSVNKKKKKKNKNKKK